MAICVPTVRDKVSNAIGTRLDGVLQHRAGIEIRGCLPWGELRECFYVHLQDVGCRHDRPEFLPRVERVGGGIHVLLEWINSKVYRPWNRGAHCLPREPVIFDYEMDFPVLVADGEEVSFP